MVCTTFYNVITNAEFKQQYTGALDNIIEEKKKPEKTSGLSPSWYHCYQYITHRLKEEKKKQQLTEMPGVFDTHEKKRKK